MFAMHLLPEQLRKNLIAYITVNPSPNVPVGQAMQMIAELGQLKTFGPKPVVEIVESEDGPVVPGGNEEVADG